jgi:hypothetical protein
MAARSVGRSVRQKDVGVWVKGVPSLADAVVESGVGITTTKASVG